MYSEAIAWRGIDFTTGFLSKREKESGMRRVPEICLAVGNKMEGNEVFTELCRKMSRYVLATPALKAIQNLITVELLTNWFSKVSHLIMI